VAKQGFTSRNTSLAPLIAPNWFFLVGFAKNEHANLDQKELKAVQELARSLLSLNDDALMKLVKQGDLMEVERGNDQV
jgi:hypothetical protein